VYGRLFVSLQRLFVLIVVGVIATAILVLVQNKKEPSQSPQAQSDEAVILQGVRQLEIAPVDYPRDLDFGKGKFILLDFFVPNEEDFRIEQVVITKKGATDTEMPEAWLRLNSVRIYTTAHFENNRATFGAFPPVIEPETWNLEPETVFERVQHMGIPYEILEDISEKQLVLKPLPPLPQLFPAGSNVSFGIYGKWADGIAPRPKENGIRFCLEEISGTLVSRNGTEQKAQTRFAQPLCGPFLGVL